MVDLPAPEGPTMPRLVPAGMSMSSAFQNLAAEIVAEAQAFEPDLDRG